MRSNFRPLEVVGCCSETQVQVGENLKSVTKLFKSIDVVSTSLVVCTDHGNTILLFFKHTNYLKIFSISVFLKHLNYCSFCCIDNNNVLISLHTFAAVSLLSLLGGDVHRSFQPLI